jgi:hypothetical protein
MPFAQSKPSGGSQTLAQVLAAGNDAAGGTIANLGQLNVNDGDSLVVALEADGDNAARIELSSEEYKFNLDSGGVGTSLSVRQDGFSNKSILRIGWNDASEIMVGYDAGKVGFYGTPGVSKQTGVAVTDAAIHAALVNLGLIAA